MSTIKVGTILAADGSTTTQPSIPALDQRMAKVWVNFDQTGTLAIRASFGVSSMTDNGSGDVTVNFTAAFADINYAPVCLFNGADGGNVTAPYYNGAPSTSSYRIGSRRTDNMNASDSQYANIVFFR
tara:strand:- start:60 stop:440 length:381 start_codon:yes stop_codon:yes gene_type:complete